MKRLIILIAALLAGCAVAPYDLTKMSPEQIKAADGLGMVTYSRALGPGYTVETRQSVFDVTKVPANVSLTQDGALGISSSGTAVVPAIVVVCDWAAGKAYVVIPKLGLVAVPAANAECVK